MFSSEYVICRKEINNIFAMVGDRTVVCSYLVSEKTTTLCKGV